MLLASCLILGDSHADGTAAAVRAALGNRCTVVARAGIGSAAIENVAKRWGDLVIDLAWARARRDGIHCQSYSWVARSIARAGYAGSVRGAF